MSQPASPYQHSGAIGTSLLLVPVAGIFASLVCGLAYAYASLHNPLVWLAVILVFVYGFAVGWVVAAAVKVSKCRNTKVAGVVAILVGLFAFYSAWAFFLFVFLRSNIPLPWTEFPTFLMSPLAQWQMVLAINNNGWFEVFASTPTGLVLWAMWTCEAFIIVAMIGAMGAGSISDEVFCERCRIWADDGDTVYLAAPEEMEELQRLAAGDLDSLSTLDPVAASECPRVQVDTKFCSRCGDMSTCQIKAVMVQQDSEGKLSESAKELTEHLLLSSEQYQELVALAQRPIPVAEDEGEDSAESEEAASEQ